MARRVAYLPRVRYICISMLTLYIIHSERSELGSMLVVSVCVPGVCGVHDPITCRPCITSSGRKNSYFFSRIFHSLSETEGGTPKFDLARGSLL